MPYSPTGHIVSGFLNAAVSGINGHLSRVQQERLSEQNRELQVRLERSRQDFQLEQGRRTEELQRELSLINIAANAKNARLAQEQQVRLFELNRDLQMELEKNRQSFQLEQGRLNAELQRELSLKNHELRLTEQQANFENLCKQAEWNLFLKSWPLMNLPSVIRAEQILPDNTVSLRVFFARSSDPVFEKAVYPRVEQGLSEFVDLYHNEFRSKNIIFYHNGFSSEVSGGAVASNIHYALRELPVIIIDSNVLFDEICVSLTMWGFGSAEKSHFTVFKLPYEPHIANGSFSVKYYSELANQLLAHLKFILGYAYDAYNLIQYNRPPLLPRIAKYEAELGGRGCLLDEPEVENAIREKYEEMGLHNNMQIMDMTAGYCAQMGLFPYYLYRQKNMAGNFENVGYAKTGKEGIYNILIMEEVQTIVACGAGSISKRVYPDGRIKRCENVKDVASFIERIDEMIERKRKLLVD